MTLINWVRLVPRPHDELLYCEGFAQKHSCSGALFTNNSRGQVPGWPIASVPDEGACKNRIKDRMERSGMRGTEQIAKAIVQLRAIYFPGSFDRYWQFQIDQDQRRLYPVVRAVVPS